MMKRKKRPLTLIEVLLSLGLTAIIFTFVLTTFFEHIKLSSKIEKAKEIVLERTYIQEKLTNIFFPYDQNTSLSISTQEEDLNPKCLYFQFDNGIDPSHEFSGIIYGYLFLKKTNLCLKIVSSKSVDIFREEILLNNVKDIQFAFYNSQTETEAMPKEKTWIKKNIRPLFFILKVTLADGEKISFPFCSRIDSAGLKFSEGKML